MSSYLLVLVAILGFAYAEGDYSLCQQREKLDDDMREMFTELHNGYRAAFARNYKTSKMRTMVYDCTLEEKAYKSAEKCSEEPSSEEENVDVFSAATLNIPLEAGNSWWSEIFELRGKVYNKNGKTSNIANMVWDSHDKLGCAVVDCSGKTHVVCQYGPEAKGDGKTIYEEGAPCSRCSDYGAGVTCDDDWQNLLCIGH
uniref:Hookworm platelet inhibitor 1 n=1 Tax=Ancylostoma caninum TaxID=29170 RepID=HPI_ANCCA|nr:RecName: Full=Hookworm platelet inhibitor 1; Short=HPI-1; Flags: Precursor [Ancylostoma caninum]